MTPEYNDFIADQGQIRLEFEDFLDHAQACRYWRCVNWMYKKSNSKGRAILAFVQVLGFVAAGCGLLLFFFGLGTTESPGALGVLGVLWGISVTVAGLVQVGIAKVGVAVFDQKDISLEMLRLMRAQVGEDHTGPAPEPPVQGTSQAGAKKAITRAKG
ncbi:hypothetical protein [Salipiger mucosus]|uniref:hypothetical protein n=1 Tax=Salipiger mucosus TaxID=263378 RepID=UPI000369B606|nr:hypothetical protein [Salipiger mucosus]